MILSHGGTPDELLPHITSHKNLFSQNVFVLKNTRYGSGMGKNIRLLGPYDFRDAENVDRIAEYRHKN